MAVLLVISLYYRSVVSLTYIFFPTLLGVAMAFGIAALTIGYLNTNTAFLGSIILGNGINFGIILLARYREQRTRQPEETVEEALAIALAATAKPTLTAALAASIAYGSLALTKFRGFQQFGEVGGMGMILCWAFTYSYWPGAHLLVGADSRGEAPAGSHAQDADSNRDRDHRPSARRCSPPSACSRCWPPGRSRHWSAARSSTTSRSYGTNRAASTGPAISTCESAGSSRRTWRRWGSRSSPAPTTRRRFATPSWSRTASPA